MPTLTLEDADATARLAERIGARLRPGDTVGLTGGLGAGKSHFCRALIAARLAETGELSEIPSPSYTLVQTYDLGPDELWHVDLYRIGGAGELVELGLDEAFGTAIGLVEWAERLGSAMPARILLVGLDFADGADDARVAEIEARGGGWDWLPEVLAGIEGCAA